MRPSPHDIDDSCIFYDISPATKCACASLLLYLASTTPVTTRHWLARIAQTFVDTVARPRFVVVDRGSVWIKTTSVSIPKRKLPVSTPKRKLTANFCYLRRLPPAFPTAVVRTHKWRKFLQSFEFPWILLHIPSFVFPWIVFHTPSFDFLWTLLHIPPLDFPWIPLHIPSFIFPWMLFHTVSFSLFWIVLHSLSFIYLGKSPPVLRVGRMGKTGSLGWRVKSSGHN